MSGRDAARSGPIVRAAGRFLARRRRSRRRAVTLVATLIVTAIAVAAAAWVVFASSAFALRTVTVEGASRVSVAQVLRAAAVTPGTPLPRLDLAGVAARVERIPAVERARVSRSWPHGLVIRIAERRPVAAVATPDGAVLLDATGVAFATAAAAPPGLVRLSVGAALPGPGAADARAAMTVLSTLPPSMRHRVALLEAPSPDAVSFALTDGRIVVWGSAAQGARKLTVLRALLHRPAHRYDVSAPDVAVTSG